METVETLISLKIMEDLSKNIMTQEHRKDMQTH
jgi:hypothetical protein